jgi:hypothetical protein
LHLFQHLIALLHHQSPFVSISRNVAIHLTGGSKRDK